MLAQTDPGQKELEQPSQTSPQAPVPTFTLPAYVRKEVETALRTLVGESGIDSSLVLRLARELNEARKENKKLRGQPDSPLTSTLETAMPDRPQDYVVQANAQLFTALTDLQALYARLFKENESLRTQLAAKETTAPPAHENHVPKNTQIIIKQLENGLAQARAGERSMVEVCEVLRMTNKSLQAQLYLVRHPSVQHAMDLGTRAQHTDRHAARSVPAKRPRESPAPPPAEPVGQSQLPSPRHTQSPNGYPTQMQLLQRSQAPQHATQPIVGHPPVANPAAPDPGGGINRGPVIGRRVASAPEQLLQQFPYQQASQPQVLYTPHLWQQPRSQSQPLPPQSQSQPPPQQQVVPQLAQSPWLLQLQQQHQSQQQLHHDQSSQHLFHHKQQQQPVPQRQHQQPQQNQQLQQHQLQQQQHLQLQHQQQQQQQQQQNMPPQRESPPHLLPLAQPYTQASQQQSFQRPSHQQGAASHSSQWHQQQQYGQPQLHSQRHMLFAPQYVRPPLQIDTTRHPVIPNNTGPYRTPPSMVPSLSPASWSSVSTPQRSASNTQSPASAGPVTLNSPLSRSVNGLIPALTSATVQETTLLHTQIKREGQVREAKENVVDLTGEESTKPTRPELEPPVKRQKTEEMGPSKDQQMSQVERKPYAKLERPTSIQGQAQAFHVNAQRQAVEMQQHGAEAQQYAVESHRHDDEGSLQQSVPLKQHNTESQHRDTGAQRPDAEPAAEKAEAPRAQESSSATEIQQQDPDARTMWEKDHSRATEASTVQRDVETAEPSVLGPPYVTEISQREPEAQIIPRVATEIRSRATTGSSMKVQQVEIPQLTIHAASSAMDVDSLRPDTEDQIRQHQDSISISSQGVHCAADAMESTSQEEQALPATSTTVPLDHPEITEFLEYSFLSTEDDASQKTCTFCRMRHENDPESWPTPTTYNNPNRAEIVGHLQAVHAEVWNTVLSGINAEGAE